MGGMTALVGLLIALLVSSLPGATIVLVGVVIMSAAMPSWGLWLVLLAFPIHPLFVRIAEVDFGVSGLSLVILSAWKEVALATTIIAAGFAQRSALRGWARIRHLPPLDYVAAALLVLVIVGVALNPSVLAVNASRLLVFPVGVYVAVRLGLLPATRYARVTVIEAAGLALFGLFQSAFLGWGFVERYHGEPGVPIPATFTAQLVEGPRAASTYSSPNEFALAMLMYGCLATALVVTSSSTRHLRWLLPATVLIWVGLAASFSRSALLAGVVGVGAITTVALLAALGTRRQTLRRLLAMAVPAVLLAALLYVDRGGFALLGNTLRTLTLAVESPPTASVQPGPSGPTSRPGPSGATSRPGPSGATRPAEPSTGGHLSSLGEGSRLLLAHPLGIGFGDVGSRELPMSSGKPGYIVESWYLMMGLSLGWAGLVWAALFLASLGWSAFLRVRRPPTSIIDLTLVGLIPAVALLSFFLPTLFEPQLAMVPWAFGGLVALHVGSTGGEWRGADGSQGGQSGTGEGQQPP